jgi:prepilin-type N-terminal cleavage/methylation domain-containing protein
MKSKKLNKSKGFTIIETLIVLAIAAAIFLVVFLAVTALNRSSRNTQRKDDAAAVIAGFSEYASNNSGQLPSFATFATPPNLILCLKNPCAPTTEAETTVKIGYYSKVDFTLSGTAGEINIIPASAGLPAAGTVNDTLNIITGAICNGNIATASGAGSRSVAAVYAIETSSGLSWVCTGS